MLTSRSYGGEPRDVPSAEQDPAGVGLLEAGDHAQQRRLARARRPEQREELAGLDGEVQGVDRHEVAEALAQIDDVHGSPHKGLGRGLSGLNGGRVGDHSARCITVPPKAAMLSLSPCVVVSGTNLHAAECGGYRRGFRTQG